MIDNNVKKIVAEVGNECTDMVEFILRATNRGICECAPFDSDDIYNKRIDNNDKIIVARDNLTVLKGASESTEKELKEKRNQWEDINCLSDDLLTTEDKITGFNLVREISKLEADNKYYNQEVFELESEISLLEEDNGKIKTVEEWVHVSSWLCSELAKRGEIIIRNANIWGRVDCSIDLEAEPVLENIAQSFNDR